MQCGRCVLAVTEPQPEEPYRLKVAPSASRDLHERLPEAVACGAIERITGPLIANPHRLGTELHNELAGLYGARIGKYRIVYRINEDQHLVEVVRIRFRADVYHR
jgi:mRNA interferase RelE/StbE